MAGALFLGMKETLKKWYAKRWNFIPSFFIKKKKGRDFYPSPILISPDAYS